MKIILKQDIFKKSRGVYSRVLNLFCENCKVKICHYQKDGAGPLKRIYVDRIILPKIIWKNNKKLLCKKCFRWIGIGMVYKVEKRKCFILFQDTVIKKIVKL